MPQWDSNTNLSTQSEQEMGSIGVGRPESRPYERSEVILYWLNIMKFFWVVSFSLSCNINITNLFSFSFFFFKKSDHTNATLGLK
jgi:hypothetical protein